MEESKSVFSQLVGIGSVTFKVVLVVVLTLVMLVPKNEIESLVYERMKRSDEVILSTSSKWGGNQTMESPILCLFVKSGESAGSYIYVVAEELGAKVKILPEERSLGIFSVVLYKSEIDLDAKFKISSLGMNGISGSAIDYEKSFFVVGVSDTVGIVNEVQFKVNDAVYGVKPGIPIPYHSKRGFHVPISLVGKDGVLQISATMKLNASEQLALVTSAKNNEIEMLSSWKDPGFIGDFLPMKREINKESGFLAVWNIHELQRNVEAMWVGVKNEQNFPKVGVKLVQVNDVYQKILRVIKYAILFIAFTFAILFISERITKNLVHPLQYILTGFASIFFYIFLLSLAEHFSFNVAYIITSVTIILLMSLYAKGIFRNKKMAYTMGGVSTFMYLFLFSTLQLEDYALLMGSGGLLIILAAVMYLTKGINQE